MAQPEVDAVCANIGPRQRAYRLRLAVVAFVAGDVLTAALFVAEAPRLLRLTVFVPFAVAALCLLEATTHVCVLLARKNARNLDDGEQPIDDRALEQRIARRARLVWVQGLAIAAGLTAALWFVP
jgi:hypothetical protein